MLEGEKVYSSRAFDAYPVSIKSKHIENRHGRLSPGWYGVILGKSTKGDTKENYDVCKTLLPDMDMSPGEWHELNQKRGCVVGVVYVSHSLPYESCSHSSWTNGAPVCNIITKAGWIEWSVPCKGNLGACPIAPGETLDAVRFLAQRAMERGEIFDTDGGTAHPYREDAWDKKRKTRATLDNNDEDGMRKMRDFLQTSMSRSLKTQSESSA